LLMFFVSWMALFFNIVSSARGLIKRKNP